MKKVLSVLLKPSFERRFVKQLDKLLLPSDECGVIKRRYVRMVVRAERNYRWTCLCYYTLSIIVMVTSVSVAALLGIDHNSIGRSAGALFWVIWSMSITLTLANKLLYLLCMHKKYVLGLVVLEKLYSEGWSFLAGVGRYTDPDTRFQRFCARIEHIHMKSLENMPDVDAAVGTILATGSSAPARVEPVRVHIDEPGDEPDEPTHASGYASDHTNGYASDHTDEPEGEHTHEHTRDHAEV